MNLLIENPIEKDPFFQKKAFKWLLIGVFLAVFFTLAFFVYKTNFELPEQVMLQDVEGDVPSTPQEFLNSFYASEALPPAPEGRDSFNYGLDEESANSEEIDGYLIFTALPKNTADHHTTNQVYYLDTADIQAKPTLLFHDWVLFGAFIEFTNLITPKDFFADLMHYTISKLPDTDKNKNSSIQKFSSDNGELIGYKSVGGEYAQSFAWSEPAGMLAYRRMTLPVTSYLDLVPIENWEVVISDIEKDEIVKTFFGATQPKWSPDGTKLLMFKLDGLYLYDLALDVEKKIVPIDNGQLISTSMFDVSPDGSYLVWTTAKSGVIVMNKILAWEDFEIEELGRIHEDGTEYYWPQFSPDGEYYVVQAIDVAEEDSVERKNPRFEIRAALHREVLRGFLIDTFDFNSFFTDTWIQKLPTGIMIK